MISDIAVGGRAPRSKDVLGRAYEYFLSRFAAAENKRGGKFYTPQCFVNLLVAKLDPYRGRVYDPCHGSAGKSAQLISFALEHVAGNGNGGDVKADIPIFGQESNYMTWRLAKMILAIRGIEGE